MSRYWDVLLTALAPIAWGTAYLVTSEWLPEGYPMTIAMLRALPIGLLMLLLIRQWPRLSQCPKILVLGGLNFTVFWVCLFVSAYQLPGGIAATLGTVQPLIIMFMAYYFFNTKTSVRSVLLALVGIAGVSLLVLKSTIALDLVGVIAALLGAVSMALGTLLTQRWRGDVPLLTFTSWQLTAGGLLLLPLVLMFEPSFPDFTVKGVFGIMWLGVIGAFLSYVIWFRGIAVLGPVQVSVLAFLSPITAILLGWFVLGQNFNTVQVAGIILIFVSIIAINYPGVKYANTRNH